jgi:hypothetical protein
VSCTFDTNKCNYPCSICFVPKQLLSNPFITLIPRTFEKMMSILNLIKSKNNQTEAYLCSKEHSVHPIEPYIWGFVGQNTPWGNPYAVLMSEKMHNTDIGVFGIAFDCFRKDCTEKQKKEMDERYAVIKDENTIAGFRLPKKGYFSNGSNTAAHEHRGMMQIVCVCIEGIVDEKYVKVFERYHDWYSIACMKDKYNEIDFITLKKTGQDITQTLKTTFNNGQQNSNFNLIKIHDIMHYEESIRRGGATSHYSASMFESMHIGLIKGPYRMTNKRHASGQIMEKNIINQLIHEIDLNFTEEDGDGSSGEHQSALKNVSFKKNK